MQTRSILSTAVLAALLAAPAAAQTPRDVADLAGARAAGAETQMVARGYQLVRNTATEDTRWNFWWSSVQQQCVSVAVSDGHYQALNVVPRENCTAGGVQAVAPPPMTAESGETLALVCYGQGNRPSVATRTEYEWDRQRHRYRPTTRVESSTEDFESDVQVELYGDHGRIHLGSRLVPPIHSGATNGWWDLQDLVVTAERITARYRLNGMNHPRLAIDRRTGHIAIDAATDFSGMCEAGSWGGRNRF
jgi:hypothetical protein